MTIKVSPPGMKEKPIQKLAFTEDGLPGTDLGWFERINEEWQREILLQTKDFKMEEYFVYFPF